MPPTVPSIAPRDVGTTVAAPDEAAAGAATASAPPLIVDVRERDEFARERVAGAALIPFSDFVARHAELPTGRPLLMLCHSGARSTSATMFLLQHANAGQACPIDCGRTWSDVRNVTGGMIAWRQAGLDVRTGSPGPADGELPPDA